MDDATTEITIKQHKSNAPWILGLIAFSTSIPNILCATVCAAVGARVSAVVAAQNATTYAEAESAANASNEAMAGALVVFVIISLVCFIYADPIRLHLWKKQKHTGRIDIWNSSVI